MTDTQINEKGARDYIRASRILWDNGGRSPPMGPINNCRGVAVEIALKLCILNRGEDHKKQHDLNVLRGICPDVLLSAEELDSLEKLNVQYVKDGEFTYASRYRPNAGRAFVSPGQDQVESLLESILAQQNPD